MNRAAADTSARGCAEFPAHAGMNRQADRRVDAAVGVPRTRGDEPFAFASQHSAEPSSPHTRG